MIASVHGLVAAVGPDGAVIEVGGVGLAVSCAPATLARLRVGEPARLATSLVVREDSLTLYGFPDDDERALFELLQTATGVGPKVAQAVLAVLVPREVRRAIATADYTTLMKVPGIGRKGAERLVLDLRDRIGSIDAGSSAVGSLGGTVSAVSPWRDQVGHALSGLGFTGSEAQAALDVVATGLHEAPETPDIAVLLRQAIQLLGRA
ncbi:MAG: ruvA [Pseudonocardiales bacterium]|nr:ruvA [Jatrophihabitantaceae bacterium]MCW2604238.1 ruvA [Pseudonocardiales bacterium]